jgi:hypothetical protein
MLIDLSNISIFVRPGITDMRKQINGLSVMAEDEMKKNSGSGNCKTICNGSKKLVIFREY